MCLLFAKQQKESAELCQRKFRVVSAQDKKSSVIKICVALDVMVIDEVKKCTSKELFCCQFEVYLNM